MQTTRAPTAGGYALSADEAEAFLERLEQVAQEVTGGRTPVYGGAPTSASASIHAHDGRVLRGAIVWDAPARCWTVTDDELGRYAWMCCARIGVI